MTPPAGRHDSREAEALRLAELWAGRTGKLVTVFAAAETVTAGQYVWPCSGTEVRPACGQVYGTALHDAGPGELVAVASGYPDGAGR